MFDAWLEFQCCQSAPFFSRLAATSQARASKIPGKCQKADNQNTYQGLPWALRGQAQLLLPSRASEILLPPTPCPVCFGAVAVPYRVRLVSCAVGLLEG